ncbi:unnamed protein product [Linum tenue]|uniref:Aminotransferase-like plant mobile domain-containing protein n=1 Tax=Linum tenue TaxID=586396 RepID=A0AAV0KEC8_9ROSI|nr:unnamed protein product [Linum tenue]
MVDTRGKKKLKEVEPSRVTNRIVLRSRREEAENERRRARLVENPSPPPPVPFDLDTAFEGVDEYDGSDDNYDDFPDVNDAFFESNHPSAGGSSGPRLEPEAPFVSSSSSQFVHVRRGARGRFESSRPDSEEGSTSKRKKAREADSWILDRSGPGGPIDHSLIPSFGGHVAYRLWDDGLGARRMDSFKLSTRALAVNYLKDYKFQSEGAAALVERTGLRKLLDCSIQHLDGPLLVAFVERWQPDTNTFHMPFGEMTITLHDVAVLLGIPVGEDMVVGNESVKAQLCEMLRVEQLNERSKPSLKSGGLVCVEAMQQVGRFRERDSEVRMFLTCLLGTTLFVDRSGDRAQVWPLQFLGDTRRVRKYSWGSATLAYLYRQLGMASRADCKGMGGYLTLLQSWIYEYFPCLRDQKLGTRGLVCGEPFAKKWEGVRIGGGAQLMNERLDHYRRVLDNMTDEFIFWCPFGPRPGEMVSRSLYSGVIRCMSVEEMYDPSRCLRQFGYVQTIPSDPLPPVDVCRSANVKMYSLSYGPGLSELWKAPQCHSVQLDSISRPVQKPEDTEDGYLQWYMGRTHPRIVCPSAADQEIHHHLSHDQLAVKLVREFRTVIEHPYDDHLDLLLGLQGLLKEYDEATPYQPPPQY